jgi:hypothetical protein
LAAAGFAGLSEIVLPGIRLRVITSALVTLVLVLTTLEVIRHTVQTGAPSYVLGLSSSEEYTDHNLGWYAPAMRAIQDLPEDAKVLMLWEPRSLYCLPSCEPDEVLDRWLVERHDRSSETPALATDIQEAWRLAGYTHLLFHKSGADFVHKEDRGNYTEADWAALDGLLDALVLVQDFGGAYQLYRLGP